MDKELKEFKKTLDKTPKGSSAQSKIYKSVKRKASKIHLSKVNFGRTKRLRKVMKSSTPTVVIKSKEVGSILNDPNRFFKSKYEEDKRNFFLK